MGGFLEALVEVVLAVVDLVEVIEEMFEE